MAPPLKPDGVFHGERLHRCTREARLWFPYLFLASNNLARLRLHYPDLLRTCFAGFAPPPSEADTVALLEQYRGEFLLFIYRDPGNGDYWGQWDTDTSTMRFTAIDSRTSPAPPAAEFEQWRKSYQQAKAQRSPASFSFSAPHGDSPRRSVNHGDAQRSTAAHGGLPESSVHHGDSQPFTPREGLRGEGLRGEVRGKESSSELEPESSPNDPIGLSLPTNRNGQEWPVLHKHITEWQAAYPAVDVLQELREMRQWLLANPARRKTARGMAAFITRWLGKEQDRGGTVPAAKLKTKPRAADASDLVRQRSAARQQNRGTA